MFLRQCLILVNLFVLSAFHRSNNQFPLGSPCPQIFQFTGGSDNRGLLSVTVPKRSIEHFNVTLYFSTDNNREDRKSVTIELRDEPDRAIENILSGRTVEYLITFKKTGSQYRLVAIQLNENNICGESLVSSDGSYLKVHTEFKAAASVISLFKETISVSINDERCGAVHNQSHIQTGIGSENTKWAMWPWAAAMYISNNYECTVNLISRSTGLTSAHCFGDNRAHPKTVQLRLFNQQVATIWGYITHYNHYVQNNDIALVFLNENIIDPQFVPACVWTASDHIGDRGTMISFGQREHSEGGGIHLTEMNSVSSNACRNTNPDLQKLVTAKHFCAGDRDGTGPCIGDSGAAFLIQVNRKWHVRGILNLALSNKETRTCDLFNYSVFLDINKYLAWIGNRQSPNTPTHTVSEPLFAPKGCGDTARSPSRDLSELTKDKQDWFVKIIRETGYVHDHGALITPRFVLTRASMFYWFRNPDIKMFAKSVWCSGRGCSLIDVKEMKFHEKYDPKTEDYNIVLMKLEKDFGFKVICIDNADVNTQNGLVGVTSRNINKKLKSNVVNMNQIGEKECIKLINVFKQGNDIWTPGTRSTPITSLPNGNLCVETSEDDKSQEDKILLLDLHRKLDGRTYWSLVGILSVEIKRKSNTSDIVSTYERIGKYTNWISDIIETE